ncbi:type II toxin-antitoxin system RelE/ParE family toxin [Massilia sp. YIM B02443]|uniref:type II toxin-antitoxin system RelE/ParE family toxin n=1 Tax=Massilia sp. YIM B02443 TaxID=3050127 RepID=UPI0025B6BEC7|nr:type II toxin-antitoxin system RelE/ParE family toxin [Massilia sp. YIM B02443]MDN4036877.1 type II toxin-antitoxin system RelE/ParE family toxin [Massilia sp. YIM B02443]
MSSQWEVEYTDELGMWWDALTEFEQESIDASVRLLEERGPHLGFPHTSGIVGSRHSHMRELRVRHEGRPYRILYAFDPRRSAILLLGGDKTGDNRWYEVNIPIADKLYDKHIEILTREGHSNGQEI